MSKTSLDATIDVVSLTEAICNIESVSGNEAALADAIEAVLKACDHLEVIRDGDAIVARTSLGRTSRVVIAGHIDVVPLANNLPVRREVIGGEPSLWGRGTVDMKGGCAVLLKLAAELERFGMTYIEGGWPGSNPRDVEFFARAKKIKFKHAKLAAFGSTRRKGVRASEDAQVRGLLEVDTAPDAGADLGNELLEDCLVADVIFLGEVDETPAGGLTVMRSGPFGCLKSVENETSASSTASVASTISCIRRSRSRQTRSPA